MKRIAYETIVNGRDLVTRFLYQTDKRIHGKRYYIEVWGYTGQTWLSDERAMELMARMHKLTQDSQFVLIRNKWTCRSCMREFDINQGITHDSTCPGDDCPSKFEEVGRTHPDCQPANM